MSEIEITEYFQRMFAELPPNIQKKAKKAIRLLGEDHRHPSLRAKPVEGAHGIFAARVDQNYRMTYERLPGDVLRLRVIAKHNEALKKP
jgi:mRNA interferase RelE/StbE